MATQNLTATPAHRTYYKSGPAAATVSSASGSIAPLPGVAMVYAAGNTVVNTITGPSPTATTVTSSLPSPQNLGTTIVYTATVSVASGSVQFAFDGVNVGSPVTVRSDGTASYSDSTLAAGNHLVTATFTPSNLTGYLVSSGSLPMTVVDPNAPPPTPPSGSPPPSLPVDSDDTVNPDLPAGLPYNLSMVKSAQAAVWTNHDFNYDFALGGLPFVGAISDSFPLDRQSTDWQKNQFDSSQEPGEQSFSLWWMRSQESFHGGAGTKYYSPGNIHAQYFGYENLGSSPIMYRYSSGVNPWSEGQLTLLRDTDQIVAQPGTSFVLSYVKSTGEDACMVGIGSEVWVYDGTTLTANVAWGGSSTILSACTDGTNAYLATSTAIYQVPFATLTGTSLWSSYTATNVTLGWVKGRLMAGVDNSVYELTTGAPILPDPIYTDNNDGWQATAICDGPDAIYVAGYAGNRGQILSFSLDSNGQLPTISSAQTVGQFPTGEVPFAMDVYLGAYVGIGTSRGIRVGVLDSSGNLQYGPLIVETVNPVRCVTGYDRFLWFGVQAEIDGQSGLIRVDLSAEVQSLRFAYAHDLTFGDSTSAVTSVEPFGLSDRMVAGLDGLWLENATRLVQSGYLQTGQVRYQTLEYKQFAGANLRGDLSHGSVTLFQVDKFGSKESLITLDGSIDLRQTVGLLGGPTDELGLSIQLNRDDTFDYLGPTVTGWQMKALPYAYNIGESFSVPFSLFDYVRDSDLNEIGYLGYAFDLWQSLKALEASGSLFQFQDLRTGERLTVRIDKIALRQSTPAAGRSTGFGGVVMVELRQVVL